MSADLFHPSRTTEFLAAVVRVRNGDNRALAEIATPLRVRLAGFLRVVGPGLSDDCWSAGLTRAWIACRARGARALEAQPSPQGYLVRSALNAAKDQARIAHRKSTREIPCGAFWTDDAPDVLEASIEAEGEKERTRKLAKIDAATAHLSRSDREILWYRYTCGYSQERTAALVGLSQPTLSRREKAILARLRALIG